MVARDRYGRECKSLTRLLGKQPDNKRNSCSFDEEEEHVEEQTRSMWIYCMDENNGVFVSG